MEKTKVAILGAGFIAHIHLESYKRFVHEAEVVAIYARSREKAEAVAAEFGIPGVYDDVDKLLAESGAEVVDVCMPNYTHYEACLKAARSGKHVIVEKPLAMTLEQADEMIAECKAHGVNLMYAEELCFAPKYERVRDLVERGAVGKVYMLKQAEKHSGPHSAWFYKEECAGGGVMMDMGCHALAWFRWMTGNAKVKSVYSDMKTVFHNDITTCEDNTVTIVEFENGVTAVAAGVPQAAQFGVAAAPYEVDPRDAAGDEALPPADNSAENTESENPAETGVADGAAVPELFSQSGEGVLSLDAGSISSIDISAEGLSRTITDEDDILVIASMLSPAGDAQPQALGDVYCSVGLNYDEGSSTLNVYMAEGLLLCETGDGFTYSAAGSPEEFIAALD